MYQTASCGFASVLPPQQVTSLPLARVCRLLRGGIGSIVVKYNVPRELGFVQQKRAVQRLAEKAPHRIKPHMDGDSHRAG